MLRIVTHWTAGGPRASDAERRRYHFLIERDGSVVRGRPVCANAAPLRARYAAHTRGLNTGSIGVVLCGMTGARQFPFDAGPEPFDERQWRLMARVVAELCAAYRIEVSPRTVLAHGEVETVLGVQQRGKWDPTVLPWSPEIPPREVMDSFRELVREAIGR